MIYETFGTLCCFPKQDGPILDCSYRSSLVQAHTVCIYYSFINNTYSKHTHAADDSPLSSVLQAPWGPKHCITKQQVIWIASHACYNKAEANGSYSWKQEDHHHQLLYTQASTKTQEPSYSDVIINGHKTVFKKTGHKADGVKLWSDIKRASLGNNLCN